MIFKTKTKLIFSVIAILTLEFFSLSFGYLNAAPASSSVGRTFGISAFVVNNSDKKTSLNGEYDVRFAIYANDSTDQSGGGQAIWQETQKIKIQGGNLNTYIGSVNPLPASMDFSASEYYLGIQIGTDSEMVPRKKLGSIPTALNALNAQNAQDAQSLSGAVTGAKSGNIPLLGNGGKLEAKMLPNISTLATVKKGVWNATAIADKYIADELTGKIYNGLTLEKTDSGFSIASSATNKLAITGLVNLDQDLLTTSTPTFAGLNLSSAIPISSGGTGLSAYAAGDMTYYSSGSALSTIARGVDGQVLVLSGGVPSWGTVFASVFAADSIDFADIKDSMTLDANLAIASSASNYSINFDSNTLFIDTANNRVGVGKNNPNYVLDVNGIVNATALYVGGSPYIGSQWTTTGGDIYYTTGNVGIGTTNPLGLLSVGATSQFQVSSAGAITAVGINSGSGLIQGTGGLTITGAISLPNSSVTNSNLANSTISGIALGTNLATLTFGTHLTGTSYNGSTGVTIATDATNANTISTIVARDASGNFSAGTITATLAGNADTVTGLSVTAGQTLTVTTGGTIASGSAAYTLASAYATASQGTTADNALPKTGGTMTGGITNSTSINPLTTLAESWIGPGSTAGIYFKGGNVGIGTTNPLGLLSVGASSQFQVSSVGAITAPTSTNTINNLIINSGALSGITTLSMNNQLTSTLADGTAPFVITSTTLNTNLNSDLLDGQHGSYYSTAGNLSGTIPSAVLGNSTLYIGTTAVALNRASAELTLTGITNLDGNAGTVTNGVYTNAANVMTLINPLTTNAESWIGPSSTGGVYFKGGNVGIGTTNPASFKLEVGGDIGPSADNVYTLGSAEKRFKDIHVGPDSLYMDNLYTDASNWEKGYIGYEGTAGTNISLDFDEADESTFSQENLAYATTVTPSAVSGSITLTLGSGNWNSNSKIKKGDRIVGNSGEAVITADPAAQTTITAYVTTSFANTNAIASSSWSIYGTDFVGGVAQLDTSGWACGSSQVADADGNLYNTVLIGSQCWQGTNMNVGTRVNGSAGQANNSITEKFCYNDNPANCTAYGGLYRGNEAVLYSGSEGAQGVCPSGWHVPSTAEFGTMAAVPGGLAAFNAPWTGYEANSGSFYPDASFFWTSTQSGVSAIGRRSDMAEAWYTKDTRGFAVRCLRDSPDIITPISTYYTFTTSNTSQVSAVGWSAMASVSIADTLNSQQAYYSVSFDDRSIFKIYDTTNGDSGWRPIARNNSGTWEYNSNVSAGLSNVTWTSATTNNQNSAISQAVAIAANQMTSAEVGSITSGQWSVSGGFAPSVTTSLNFSVSMYSSSTITTPSVNQITVNYQGNAALGIMTLGTKALGSGTVRDMQFKVGDTNALYVKSSGNVGIGTTNPLGLLSVGATSQFQISSAGAITAPTATNTINGLIINSGALSGVTTMSMSGQLTSTLASGTAPLVVASDTLVANLNADLIDGHDTSYFQVAGSYQTQDATLTSIAALGTAADKIAYTTGVDTWAETALTSFGRSLIDDADNTAARTTLGLGTLATLSTINNANWSGTDLAVDNGGTGASTFSANYLLKGNGASALSSSILYDDGTNIGIGTASPNSKLSIFTTAGNQMTLGYDATHYADFLVSNAGNLSIAPNTAGATTTIGSGADVALKIDSTGKVGIGTTSPNAGLEISGTNTDGTTPIALKISETINSVDTVNQEGLCVVPSFSPAGASVTTVYGILDIPIITGSAVPITNYIGVMGRTDTGVGYTGTISNARAFQANTPSLAGLNPITNYTHFYGGGISNGNGITTGTINNYGFFMGANTAAAGSGGTINNYGMSISVPSGAGAGTTNNYGLVITGAGGGANALYSLYNSSTAKSYFNNSVGIGTTNPSGLLHIYGGANRDMVFDSWGASGDIDGLLPGSTTGSLIKGADNAHMVFGLQDNDANDGFYFVTGGGNYVTDSTYDTMAMAIKADGNVGIGTTDPGTYNLYITGTGYLGGASAWTYGSDSRLKENISKLSYGLSDIMKLNPQKFDYITGAKNQFGFIAQDVQGIMPELVEARADGMLGLKTDMILPVMVNAMKQQQTQITGIADNQNKITEQLTGQLADQSLSVDNKITLIGASLDNLTNQQIVTIKDQLDTQAKSFASLQKQMDDLKLLNQSVMDFAAALDINKETGVINLNFINGKITAGSIVASGMILNGQLEAEGIVAGAFSVKVKDENSATIGKSSVCVPGKILASGLCKDPSVSDTEIPSDGKSIIIKNTAVTAASKVFVTPKTVTDKPLSVTQIIPGVSFKVEVKDQIQENIEFDWFMVEEK